MLHKGLRKANGRKTACPGMDRKGSKDVGEVEPLVTSHVMVTSHRVEL